MVEGIQVRSRWRTIIGRVSRSFDEENNEEVEDTEEATEAEEPVEVEEPLAEEEVEYYTSPEMLPAEDYLIGQLADRNLELEDRVSELEE